jgi:hypothetical protein
MLSTEGISAMLLNISCSQGHLQLTEQDMLQVVAPFNHVLWSIPRNSLLNIVEKQGMIFSAVEIQSSYGTYLVEMLKKNEAKELVTWLHNIPPGAAAAQYRPPRPGEVPIDVQIQQVKAAIEQKRLELRAVNTNMSAIRARYQQHHVHGGGKFGGFVRDIQRGSKDGRLSKLEPSKEKLQREKLFLEQHLAHLKALKAQGVTHVIPPKEMR